MKLSTTLAIVSTLAVSGWAAAPGQPTALAPAMFQAATCPTPAPTVPAAKKTWKHGDAEYKDFTAAAGAANPSQKAQLAAAFVQKYPDSDYKIQALQLQMSAQAGIAGQQGQAVQTAETLIKSGSADASALLPAYTIIAFLDPQLVQLNDPDMAAKMATLTQAATCGQQLLASAPAAQQAQYGPILTKALGFAQLNTKNYDAAIATLTQATQQNPKDPLPYYWIGFADVSKTTPDISSGLFYLAKASVLSPQTAAFKTYLTSVYTQYHGSADGLDDVITTATSNAAPPAGYKVMSKVDVENAAAMAAYQAKLEALKNQLPPENSFAGIEARLKKPDMAAAMWKKTKGVGYELEGLVRAITPKTVDVAVGATDASTPADVHLILALPLTKRPKVGEKVTIDGVALSFKPNPPNPNSSFLLTMNEGSIKGYSPTAPKAK